MPGYMQVPPIVYEFAIQVFLLLAITIPLRIAIRHRTKSKLVLDAAVFIVLSTLFFSRGIEPYAPAVHQGLYNTLIIGAAKGAWWISLSLLLVNIVRKIVVFEHRPREGRLLRDLLSGAIYIGTGLSLIAYVFNVPVGTVIATSGVFAIVIGLALQSTLNDVFSGIALNLGRPYLVGDWIVLEDNLQGRVIETNWRSTHLLSGTNDIIILPNSTLAKSRLTNYSSPDESHGITMTVKFQPTERPEILADMVRTALLGCTKLLRSSPASVAVTALEGDAVSLEINCRVKDVGKTSDARNEVFDLVYRHARAAGLRLALPAGWAGAAPSEPVAYSEQGALDCLLAIPLFNALTRSEREMLADGMRPVLYPKGSVISSQGSALVSLILIQRGVVLIERREDVRRTEIARLSPGDLFGERGVLMGQVEAGDATALTPVIVYEIAKDRLSPFMKERPEIVEQLGFILSHRLEKERHLLDDHNATGIPYPNSLAGKIKNLFGL